jgi:hypothetical protein
VAHLTDVLFYNNISSQTICYDIILVETFPRE